MKKLGIIIMIALALTVGGVYATFVYAQNDVASVDGTLTSELGAKALDTAKGTIKITTDFKVLIDDLDSNLTTKYTTSGSTKITFTPAQGADQDVVDNGIKLKLTIAFGGTNAYEGTPIFKTKDAYTADGVLLNGGNKVLGDITVDLADYIDVSLISLPTSAKYDAFKTAFDATTLSVIVSEAA